MGETAWRAINLKRKKKKTKKLLLVLHLDGWLLFVFHKNCSFILLQKEVVAPALLQEHCKKNETRGQIGRRGEGFMIR